MPAWSINIPKSIIQPFSHSVSLSQSFNQSVSHSWSLMMIIYSMSDSPFMQTMFLFMFCMYVLYKYQHNAGCVGNSVNQSISQPITCFNQFTFYHLEILLKPATWSANCCIVCLFYSRFNCLINKFIFSPPVILG